MVDVVSHGRSSGGKSRNSGNAISQAGGRSSLPSRSVYAWIAILVIISSIVGVAYHHNAATSAISHRSSDWRLEEDPIGRSEMFQKKIGEIFNRLDGIATSISRMERQVATVGRVESGRSTKEEEEKERQKREEAVRRAQEIREKEMEGALTSSSVRAQRSVWFANEHFHAPPIFPLCSVDACFNFSKCESRNKDTWGQDPSSTSSSSSSTASPPPPPFPLVFSYWPGPYYFQTLNASRWFTPDPAKACFFFVFLGSAKLERFEDLPFWGKDGLNHVLVSFSDSWNGPRQTDVGKSMLILSNALETLMRSSFDVSIPLPRLWKSAPTALFELEAGRRKYFLTFMGTRYLGGLRGDFRSHEDFISMHNGKDVIVVARCGGSTNARILKEHPELMPNCSRDFAEYRKFRYDDTMNSTFGLSPAGRQPSTYRFLEMLSAGVIPVVIADNWKKPFDDIIPWRTCLLSFPTTKMKRILPTLRKMPPEVVEVRRKSCCKIFTEFLQDDETLLATTMQSLISHFYGSISK